MCTESQLYTVKANVHLVSHGEIIAESLLEPTRN